MLPQKAGGGGAGVGTACGGSSSGVSPGQEEHTKLSAALRKPPSPLTNSDEEKSGWSPWGRLQDFMRPIIGHWWGYYLRLENDVLLCGQVDILYHRVHTPKASNRPLTVGLGINWENVQLSSKGHMPMFQMCRTHEISHGDSRSVVSSRLAQCHS